MTVDFLAGIQSNNIDDARHQRAHTHRLVLVKVSRPLPLLPTIAP
jgi:hypothetical protein